ncbi:hypothetical protein IRJ41_018853, partial [Triplophysa rosa]
ADQSECNIKIPREDSKAGVFNRGSAVELQGVQILQPLFSLIRADSLKLPRIASLTCVRADKNIHSGSGSKQWKKRYICIIKTGRKEMTTSPEPSCVSMKSNNSMIQPIGFSDGGVTFEPSVDKSISL